MPKEKCRYCHGWGMNASLWDHGIINGYGERQHMRLMLHGPTPLPAYRCDRCDEPKDLPAPELKYTTTHQPKPLSMFITPEQQQ